MTDKPKINLQTPRGTRDLFFEKAELFSWMESLCARMFRLYGYAPIRTPHFESADLFKRSIGEETDIVEKEMFVFEDRGERQLALRPEGTAPVARAFIENGLYSRGDVTRLFYSGPMFRAERPQAGRYREFWQAGAECFGLKDASADAEAVVLLHHLLSELLRPASTRFSIRLNSLGCGTCRLGYRYALQAFLEERKDVLCEDCRRRMKKNPLRALDCKIDGEKLIRENAPAPIDYLCEECAGHFQRVRELLNDASCPVEISPRLVRGLDYYTGTVFEVTSADLGSQNALAAGGRYDTLVSDLGGPETPAVGFAIGLDRVAEVLDKGAAKVSPAANGSGSKVFIAVLGPAAASKGFSLLKTLRAQDFVCEGILPDKSLKAQMRYAGSSGTRWAVILGDQELQEKSAMVKDLSNGSQEKVPLENLAQHLKNAAATGRVS